MCSSATSGSTVFAGQETATQYSQTFCWIVLFGVMSSTSLNCNSRSTVSSCDYSRDCRSTNFHVPHSRMTTAKWTLQPSAFAKGLGVLHYGHMCRDSIAILDASTESSSELHVC
jgi:hypothetical protein